MLKLCCVFIFMFKALFSIFAESFGYSPKDWSELYYWEYFYTLFILFSSFILLNSFYWNSGCQDGERERGCVRAMRPRALLRSLSSPDTMRHRRRFQAADSSQLHLEGRGRISKKNSFVFLCRKKSAEEDPHFAQFTKRIQRRLNME